MNITREQLEAARLVNNEVAKRAKEVFALLLDKQLINYESKLRGEYAPHADYYEFICFDEHTIDFNCCEYGRCGGGDVDFIYSLPLEYLYLDDQTIIDAELFKKNGLEEQIHKQKEQEKIITEKEKENRDRATYEKLKAKFEGK